LNQQFNNFLFVFFFLIALCIPSQGKSEVIFPPDLTFTNKKSIIIYGFVENGEPVEGEVNFIRKFEIDGDEFFQGEVELFPGMNIINIGGETLRVFTIVGSKLDFFKMMSGEKELTFHSYGVHPALEEGCESCHSYDEGDISINGEIRALCFECHDDPAKDDSGEARPFIHSPVLEEECTECHDPHFSKNRKLLTKEKICLECHDDKDPEEGDNKSIHEPVRKIECAKCHDPHASKFKYHLKREGTGLCFGCHGDFTKDGEGKELNYVHGPVADGDCVACHKPHFSKNRKLLVEEKICLECHDDKDPEEGDNASVHGPVSKMECVSCHNPHASPNTYQLVKAVNKLCYDCHEKPHRIHISSEVKSTAAHVPENFPVEKDGSLSCLGCHDPHFTANRRLFKEQEAILCIKCHKM
jgi:predicted CXXCH cytochrome family protein